MATTDDEPNPKRARVDGTVALVTIAKGFQQHPGLIKMWRDGTLCDVTLQAEGRSFPAHRNVLGACSTYFAAALIGSGAQMSDGGRTGHAMSEVSATVLEAALTYLYEGQCEVPQDTLTEILALATRLDMKELTTNVALEIASRLTHDSCVGAWALADAHQVDDLAEAAKLKCLMCRHELVANGCIGALTHAQFVALLADDRLAVEDEADAYGALEAWWGAQPEPPSAEATASLLRLVRFGLVDKEMIRGRVRSATLAQHRLAQDAIMDALLDGNMTRRCGAVFYWRYADDDGDEYSQRVTGWRPLPGERLKLVTASEHAGQAKGCVGDVCTILRDDFDARPFLVRFDAIHPTNPLTDPTNPPGFVTPDHFDLRYREPLDEARVRLALTDRPEMTDDQKLACLMELVKADGFPSKTRTAVLERVLRYFQTKTADDDIAGCTVSDATAALQDNDGLSWCDEQVRQIVDRLVVMGELHATVDNDHFKATV